MQIRNVIIFYETKLIIATTGPSPCMFSMLLKVKTHPYLKQTNLPAAVDLMFLHAPPHCPPTLVHLLL